VRDHHHVEPFRGTRRGAASTTPPPPVTFFSFPIVLEHPITCWTNGRWRPGGVSHHHVVVTRGTNRAKPLRADAVAADGLLPRDYLLIAAIPYICLHYCRAALHHHHPGCELVGADVEFCHVDSGAAFYTTMDTATGALHLGDGQFNDAPPY